MALLLETNVTTSRGVSGVVKCCRPKSTVLGWTPPEAKNKNCTLLRALLCEKKTCCSWIGNVAIFSLLYSSVRNNVAFYCYAVFPIVSLKKSQVFGAIASTSQTFASLLLILCSPTASNLIWLDLMSLNSVLVRRNISKLSVTTYLFIWVFQWILAVTINELLSLFLIITNIKLIK